MFVARTGYAWEQMNMQGKDTPRRPERVMAASSSSDTIENDTEKTKSAHKEKLVISDSDHIDRESEDVIKTEEAADAEEIPESGRIRRGSVHLVEEADDVEADVFVMDEDLNIPKNNTLEAMVSDLRYMAV